MQAAAPNQLRVVFGSDEVGVSTYNPFEAEVTNEAWNLIYETLVTLGLDGHYYPRLATSWSVSDDGLVWRFTLRKGVTFHDGTPFTVANVVWTVERLRTSPSGLVVEMIDRASTPDDWTLVLHLTRPTPHLLYFLSLAFFAIPSRAAVESDGARYGIRSAAGTGPYMLESFRIGEETVLVRNLQYTWGGPLTNNKGPAYIERIAFREIGDESTAFLELRTAGVDMLLEVPPVFRRLIQKLPGVGLTSIPGQENWHLVMNTRAGPLADLRVRHAIALAIDRELLVKALFAGNGRPADTYLIPSLPENRVAEQYRVRYDPHSSRALLRAAEWFAGKDGVLVRNGARLRLRLWTTSKTEFRRVAEVIQAQLASVGIEVVITQFDASTIRAQFHRNEHELALRSYGYNNADILEWFFNSARPGFPNVAMWSDARSDRLMKSAMTATTLQQRTEKFTRYHEYLLSQWLWVPIFWPNDNIAYDSRRVQVPALRTWSILDPAILDMRLT